MNNKQLKTLSKKKLIEIVRGSEQLINKLKSCGNCKSFSHYYVKRCGVCDENHSGWELEE